MRVQLLVTLLAMLVGQSVPHSAAAQSDARQRQAAAEAYDRGTAAYLGSEYSRAAQWFETANRMAPAAPALMQAVRAHQRAENFPRAATLALRLSESYGDEPAAAEYSQSVLSELSNQYLRVDVLCDADCRVDLDGKLQEFHSFFLEPGSNHTVTANFDTGERTAEITGDAGESRTLEFEAPPPPPEPDIAPEGNGDGVGRVGLGPDDLEKKPLPPVITYIGAGLTGALLAGSILSMLDMNSAVDDYETAVAEWRDCQDDQTDCDPAALRTVAEQKLEDGLSKETRTFILWVATGAIAATTAVIAAFLTDWSSDAADDDLAVIVTPTADGAFGMIEARF